jgi:uncharacterized protein (DUF1778 family)
VAQVVPRRNARRKVTISLRIPRLLLASLQREAAQSGQSVSAFIMQRTMVRAELDLLTRKVFRALDAIERSPHQLPHART